MLGRSIVLCASQSPSTEDRPDKILKTESSIPEPLRRAVSPRLIVRASQAIRGPMFENGISVYAEHILFHVIDGAARTYV